MKRVLTLFLCIAFSLAVVAVPEITAMAENTSDYEDYVPGEMPANLFICGSGGMYDTVNIGSTGTNCKLGRNGYGYYITATSTETGEGEVGACYMGNEGAYKLHGGYYTAALFSNKIKYGTNYVVSFMTRKGATSEDTAINFAVYDYSQYKLQYTSEYGKDGLELNSTDWVPFKGTIQIPEGTSGTAPQFVIGLSETAPKGTAVDARIVAQENYKTSRYVPEMYIAEEVAYDIENNLISGNNTVKVGDELTFEAFLANQIGLPGCFDQTFEWLAMDTDRQNEISGISIVPSDDTMTATVTIEDTLVPGSYDIVAYSEEYDMAKGYTITLEAPYYYEDNGSMTIEAKLNSNDEWTTDKVTTGLVNYIEVKATLAGNTEAFEWIVTDKNRLTLVEDVFTLTPVTAEGAEQTVKVEAITGVDIKPGDYNIIAVSKDGSVKAHPINLDITKDIDIILDTFTQGTEDEIEEGLNTTYLSVLGLLDSNSSKADKSELAAVISGAAKDGAFDDATEVEDIREILETLAAVSFYNVTPEDMELIDENGDFAYSEEIGIDAIDTDGVTLYALYKEAVDEQGKDNITSSVIGKDFVTAEELVDTLKESILLNAIEYPNVNGTGYVGDILTEANLKAVSVDSGNYLDSDMKASYHSKIAGEKLTIAELEEELAKEYKKETGSSSGGGGGGGSSSGSGSKKTGFGSDITAPANPAEDESSEDSKTDVKYDDVSDGHWAFPEIVFLSKLGVINGANGNFNPEKTVTREEILKMICVAFDIKADGAQCDFSDVANNAWYYDYVAAAKHSGIVNGISQTEFGIGKAVTRQDICVMVMRAAQMTGDGYPEAVFTDSADVASYAKDSVNCLNALYVINGFSDGSFKPNASCTKAQAAKIISNALHILSGISE